MRATQTLVAKKMKNMLVKVDGALPRGVTAKDVILSVIGRTASAGAPAMRSSLPAPPSARYRWKAG